MVTTPTSHRIEELPVDACLELLRTRSLGRIGYVADGKPRILPLTYGVHQGSVLFRIGYGDLLDAVHGQEVVFEVDHGDPEMRTGWSVIVHGIAEEIWRSEELAVAQELTLRPWAPGNRDHYVRILSSAITGRRIV